MTCWVIVEPPWLNDRERMLLMSARKKESRRMPLCSKKRWSSMAMVAFMAFSDISS